MSRSTIHLQKSFESKFTRPEILLEPQIIKPLHSVNPRTILGRQWWDETRQKAYETNNYCCWACGTHKSKITKTKQQLEGHESYEINITLKRYRLVEVVALCPKCHNFIHMGRLMQLLKAKIITQQQFDIITDWGNGVLYRAGLNIDDAWWVPVQKHFFPERMGTWNDWYILINDKKYFSKFKTFEEWKEYYKIK